MASFKNLISSTAAQISSGGTITGDLTISGDLTVSGTGGGYAYTEVLTGDMIIDQDTNAVALTIDTEATSAYGMHFNNPAQQTGTVIGVVEANDLTTGGIFYGISNSSSTGARSLFRIYNYNASATGTAVANLAQRSTGYSLEVDSYYNSGASAGAKMRLTSNDGSAMGSGDRLGVIEFSGAEDNANNLIAGARIEAVTDAAWSASENGADLVFYTTDGDATQSEAMRLTAEGDVVLDGTANRDTLSITNGLISLASNSNSGGWSGYKIGHYSGATSVHGDIRFFDSAVGGGGLYYDQSENQTTLSFDQDSEYTPLVLQNRSDAADTTGSVSQRFDLEDTGGTIVDSGKILVGKEASFTATASTQDSYMAFQTSLNGSLSEKMRINSAGGFQSRPLIYNTGTATQSGTTVTGSGTNWGSADHVGAEFVWADGVSVGKITACASTTSITVTESRTVGSAASYSIHAYGINTKTKFVGINTDNPTHLLHVKSGGHYAYADAVIAQFESPTYGTYTLNNAGGGLTWSASGNYVMQYDYNDAFQVKSSAGKFQFAITEGVKIYCSPTSSQLGGNSTGFGTEGTMFGMYAGHELVYPNLRNMAIGHEAMYNTNSALCDDNIFIGYESGAGAWAVGSDLATGTFANNGYNTFSSATDHSFTAVETDSATSTSANTNHILITNGNSYLLEFTATLTSGAVPTVNVLAAAGGSSVGLSGKTVISGANKITFTGTVTDSSSTIQFTSVGNTSYAIADLTLKLAGGAINNVAIGNYTMDDVLDGASYNVAVGHNSLSSLTTGYGNTAVGYEALKDNTTGVYNTAIGYQSGHHLVPGGATPSGNTYVGYQSGFYMDDGASNVGVGYRALYSNASEANDGADNVALGRNALMSLTDGYKNVALGRGAGEAITTDTNVVAIGYGAYNAMDTSSEGTDGSGNTAIGHLSMSAYTNAGCIKNTAIGFQSMGTGVDHAAANNVIIGYKSGYSLDAGGSNTYLGHQAGYHNPGGSHNVFLGADAGTGSGGTNNASNVGIGSSALLSTQTNNTVAIGYQAAKLLTTGAGNTAIGHTALLENTTGAHNTVIGYQTMYRADGDAAETVDCIFIGSGAGSGAWGNYTSSNNTVIGTDAMNGSLNGTTSNVVIGHDAGQVTPFTGGSNVLIGADSDLGTHTDASCVIIGKDATSEGSYSTFLGMNGIKKYKTRRITITAAHSGVNSIIAEVFKIPALSIIHRVTCTVITKSTDVNPYTLNLQLSTTSGTLADGALVNSGTSITVPEILGAGGVATYAQNSGTVLGTAADILAGTGGVNKTVYTAMPTTTIVGTNDTYLYVCNAVDNGTSASSSVVLDICVEYSGQD